MCVAVVDLTIKTSRRSRVKPVLCKVNQSNHLLLKLTPVVKHSIVFNCFCTKQSSKTKRYLNPPPPTKPCRFFKLYSTDWFKLQKGNGIDHNNNIAFCFQISQNTRKKKKNGLTFFFLKGKKGTRNNTASQIQYNTTHFSRDLHLNRVQV